MEVTTGLERMMGSLADHYLQDDNEAGVDYIPVRFVDDTPHAAADGSYVAVNPDVRDAYGKAVGAVTELRIIADTLAHEVEHVNQSDLGGKQDMADANPDMPKAAGMVANILEDAYIDTQRIQRYPGQKVSHQKKVDAIMGNHQRRPKVSTMLDKQGMVAALIETALQVSYLQVATPEGEPGYAKGLEDLEDDHPLVEFAARWVHVTDVAREADDVDERQDAMQGAVDLLREYAPDNTSGRDMDEATDEVDTDQFDEDAPDLDDLDLDPSDLDRDANVDERLDQDDGDDTPDPQDVDADDLGDELDDLADDPDDGWDGLDGDDDTPDGTEGDDHGDDPDGPDVDASQQDAPDTDGAAGDPDDGFDPDGAPDTPDQNSDMDGDSPEQSGDGPDGDGGGDPDGDADTSRVDAVLDEYDPTDLEVVR